MDSPSSPSYCEMLSIPTSQSDSPDPSGNMLPSLATMSKSNGENSIFISYVHPPRSTEFWFEDGNTVVWAGNTLYNVHASVMKRLSGFFREELNTPISSSATITPKATSVRDPLHLFVPSQHFDLLLTMIYPSNFKPRCDISVEEWVSIAHAATILEIPSIRKLAFDSIMSQAKRCIAPELIYLGRLNDLEECVLLGCRMLCVAEEPLSLEEGNALGMEMVIEVARVRELLAKGKKWSELELGRFVTF